MKVWGIEVESSITYNLRLSGEEVAALIDLINRSFIYRITIIPDDKRILSSVLLKLSCGGTNAEED